MKWKNFLVGTVALLTLTINNAQVSAVEVFGGEFEEEQTPQETTEEVAEPAAQPANTVEEDDEDLGDELNFDVQGSGNPPAQVEEPTTPTIVEEPNRQTGEPEITYTPATNETTPQNQEPTYTPRTAPEQKQKKLKLQKPRFVKLTMDDSYVYYLDKQAVTWKKIPYFASEYMADVWIRMIERDDQETEYPEDEVALAAEQGKQLPDSDIEVLQHKRYYLEHYYLRPKTEQIQFLSELEIVDRPQNTANERRYDYQNWEYLIPGSMESVIYRTVIQTIGTSKASERGHMTFVDMLEEYGRISLR